jgi:FixJ family two-component response regulator
MSVSKGRILIVDDESAIRELLISEFSKLGYETFSAENGNEAISKVDNERIHIVLTDMKMPKLDGLDFLKYVKEKSPETEVIIITGHATVENALNAMHNGAYDFIQKPFNIDELIALVDKAMEKNELKILVALYESSNAIFSSLKLEELFPVMISLLKNATSSKNVSIFLKDNIEQMYLAASSIPMFDSQRREVESLVLKVYGDSLKRYKSLVFNVGDSNHFEFENIFDEKTEIKSVLIYPMVLNNHIMGYLVLTKEAGMSSFIKSDLKNISVFAVQIAQSINNTKLYEKLEMKIAELEQVLSDLDVAKKEIQSLRKDTIHVYKK